MLALPEDFHRCVCVSGMPRRRGFNAEVRDFLQGIDLVSFAKKPVRSLEIGCGDGGASRYLNRRYGIEAHGVDIVPFDRLPDDSRAGGLARRLANALHLGGRFSFRLAPATKLPYSDESFDSVFSYMAWPYLPDQLRGLSEAHRVLKVGGVGLLGVSRPTTMEFCGTIPPLSEIIAACPQSRDLKLEIVEVGAQRLPYRRLRIDKTSSSPLELPLFISSWLDDETKLYTTCLYAAPERTASYS